MTKKKKSVERTKPTKNNTDIIQIKQPLSSGSQNANSNKNTQIVQVIFPPDTEIRKKRKKRKGKSKAQKKKEQEKQELLEELKSRLKEYDELQAESQELQIAIPEELAIPVINEGDLKTNEDIQNYINDVVNKIQLLQGLLEKEKNPPVPQGLPVRLGAGILNIPTQPALRPQIQPQLRPRLEPEIKPEEPEEPEEPIEPEAPIEPLSPVTDKTKEALDRIAKEIQDKIGKDTPIEPPPQTKPLEPPTKPLEPPTPTKPLQPLEPIPDTELEKISGVLIGNRKYDLTSPKGFMEFYDRYRRYMENVDFLTIQGQIADGIYHIPLDKSNQLNNTRKNFRKEYGIWYNNLSPNVREYMKRDKLMNAIHNEMGKNTELKVVDLAEDILKSQKIKVIEITAGSKAPDIEKEIQGKEFTDKKIQKQNEDLEKFRLETNKKINVIYDKINKAKGDKQKLQQLDTIINKTDQDWNKEYDKVPYEVKLNFTVEKDNIEVRLNDMRDKVDEAKKTIVLPKPRPPNQANIKKKNLAILKKFKANPNPNVTDKIKEAVEIVLGQDKLDRLNNFKNAKAKREFIKNEYDEYITNRVVIDERERQERVRVNDREKNTMGDGLVGRVEDGEGNMINQRGLPNV